ELDQAVATAAWSQLVALSGQSLPWPATTVLVAVRDEVRGRLRTAARRQRRIDGDTRSAPVAVTGADQAGAEAADLLAAAVRQGLVSADSARVVWATRVIGLSVAELGTTTGRPTSSIRTLRSRAEQAL